MNSLRRLEKKMQPPDFSSISEPLEPENKADKFTQRGEIRAESEAKIIEIREKIQNMEERKKYAEKIFSFMQWWISGIFLILIHQGFLSPLGVFEISEGVLLAVIGGTTVNIIGLFVIVAKYLFPSSKAKESTAKRRKK